ncbi:MAG: metalloregulator ArsR/SmtB family transcription factor [Desulfobulbus oligotrophicus]|jgi:DNA-binding transcriptional ArsR family regulator|nr:metalloregulator ArsR/SmtB family transcription factor [Desulfobulbus oligotrophicus]
MALPRIQSEVSAPSGEQPSAVDPTRAEILSEEDAQAAAELFKMLGEPGRIKILHALSKEERCVHDLAAHVGMGQSAVSHQLRLLRNARLVKYRKEGKMAWYSLDDEHVFSLLSQGIEHISHR